MTMPPVTAWCWSPIGRPMGKQKIFWSPKHRCRPNMRIVHHGRSFARTYPAVWCWMRCLFQAHGILLRENALPRILVETQATGETEAIEFNEEAYDLALGAMGEYDTTRLRFTYASMTTPMQTTDYDMGTGTHILRKSQNVPSGHDPADYVTRRITATSHDGAEVPVSIVYHRDTPLDGSAPVLLYGYGAYGNTIHAVFSFTTLSLDTRGFK